MCGIVGAFPIKKPSLELDEKQFRLMTMYLFNELLLRTVERGKDATGIAAAFPAATTKKGKKVVKDGKPFWCVIKQPVESFDFFENDGTASRYKGQDENANAEAFMDVISTLDRPLLHLLGHTRAKTVGSEYNPLNNHPILVGNIIGIHNGGVKNADQIYKKHPNMTPQGEVDSEAIMQLLAEVANDRPLGEEDIKYVADRIEGPRAVLAYNRLYPERVIYFRNHERPIEIGYIPEIGLALLHSERKFLKGTIQTYNRLRLSLRRDLPELSIEWRNVPMDKGGVIDVNEMVDDDEISVEEMFPLIDCPKWPINEYKDGYKPKKENTWTGGKKNKDTSTNNSNKSSSTSSGTSSSKFSKPKPPPIQEADIIDSSEYGVEQEEDSRPKVVNADQVIDDNSEEEENISETSSEQEELEDYGRGEGTASQLFSDDELIAKGIEWALSEETRKDERFLLAKQTGRFATYLGVPKLSEDDAEELAQQLYPKAAGEGFMAGYRLGSEEEANLRADEEADAAKIEELEEEIRRLKSRNREHTEDKLLATSYIANMKAFVLGAIIVKGLAHVEGKGKKARLVFDEELGDFIAQAKGFEKVDAEAVAKLFTSKDLEAISGGVHSVAQKVKKTANKAKGKQKKKLN